MTGLVHYILPASGKHVREMCNFYIAKLGYAGVYLFFLFLLQNIDCGYSLEPPRRGGSIGEAVLTSTHNRVPTNFIK